MSGMRCGMNPYLSKRNGLPNFTRSIAERPVTVGYLGGSLTMMKDGWRPLFHEWLNHAHPDHAPHHQLHVGRGGVGSASGVFFVQDEICGHGPDLVFVEYAINDSFEFLTPHALRAAAIEGILHNIWASNPDCEICFVYMHHVLRGAEISGVIDDYEMIAQRYGIPSIHVGRYLLDLVSHGEWSFAGGLPERTLLRDQCHPSHPGNQVVSGLIKGAVDELLSSPITHHAFRPVIPNASILAGGRLLPLDTGMIRGPFTCITGPVGGIHQDITRYCLGPDANLEIEGDFSLVGLYVVVGPTSGIIRAQAGRRTCERNLFDEWCSYQRISTCILVESAADLMPPYRATTIRLTERIPDHSVCPKLEAIPVERSLDVVGLFVV